MNLLPEQQCANHISKLLDAANEAGLCVPRSINAENCRKFILSEVQLADALQIDSGTIDRSISHWIFVRKQGQRWAPWHLGAVLAEERDAGIVARRIEQRKPKTDCPVKPEMVQTQDEKDQQEASKRMKIATMPQQLAMVQWAIRQTGRESIGMGFFAAFLTRVKHERTVRK